MGKKKYLIIIAAIIFVFLGIFAFANPFNKEEEIDKDVIEEVEEVEKEDEVEENEEEEVVIEPVYTPIYNNHGVSIDKETSVEDKSYEFAEEALVKAEITLSIEDLNKAIELIEKVKNEDERKKLEDRVEVVIETLDLTDLVNTFVKNVNSAENKTDMNQARNLLAEKDLIKRLDNLSNEVIKKLLSDKLATVLSKVEDTTNPSVNIEDEAILSEDTKIIVTDESEVTIVLNEEEIDNEIVVSDGKYTLTVTDASFNTTTIEFIIDTIAPEFVIGEESIGNGEYFSKLDLTLIDENLKTLDINGVEDNAISPFEIPSEYYVKGENVLVATDVVGNETTFTFTLVEDVIVLEETYTFETSEEMITINEDETYVIDLNNNVYEIEERLNARIFENKGTLIIKNGKMENKSTGYQYGIVNNYGKLIIENVEFIDNANGDGSTIRNRGGEIIIKNSSFENKGTTNIGNAAIISEGKLTVEKTNIKSASNQIYPLQVRAGEGIIKNVNVEGTHGALCVNGGTVVIDDLKYTAQKYYGIFITNNGGSTGDEETNVTINSGTFIGESYGIHASVDDSLQDAANVNITINGGTFEGNDGALRLAGDRTTTRNWNVTINGGTFNGNLFKGSKYNTTNWDLSINGGSFTSSVASDLTEEYEEILNSETGYYEINKKNA